MNTTPPRPTPETDACISTMRGESIFDLCKKLERERDEAIIKYTGEADELERQRNQVIAKCEEARRERDEARDQLQAMREAIREALKAIVDLHNDDFPSGGDFSDTAIDAFNKGNAALAKLQPFIAA